MAGRLLFIGKIQPENPCFQCDYSTGALLELGSYLSVYFLVGFVLMNDDFPR